MQSVCNKFILLTNIRCSNDKPYQYHHFILLNRCVLIKYMSTENINIVHFHVNTSDVMRSTDKPHIIFTRNSIEKYFFPFFFLVRGYILNVINSAFNII